MRFSWIHSFLIGSSLLVGANVIASEWEGRWKGSVPSNYGASFICNGWLEYSLEAKNGKMIGDFSLMFRSTHFETKLQDDGSFDGSHAMTDGIDLKIIGKAGDNFSLISTQYGCGWKEISLKR